MYLKRYPDTPQGRQSAIMPLLWVAQQQTDEAHDTIKAKPAYDAAFAFVEPQGSGGWVPLAAMHAIADKIGEPRRAAQWQRALALLRTAQGAHGAARRLVCEA